MANAEAPLYATIADELRAKIVTGAWPAASKIPTEFELCDHYHVSRSTIRRALDQLDREQLVVRKKARGTFVRDVRQQHEDLHSTMARGFTDEMREMGGRARTFSASVAIERPDLIITSALGIKPGSSALALRRLRGIGDDAFSFHETFLVPFGNMPLNDEAYYGSLYELLRQRGTHPQQLQECLEACMAPASIREQLGIGKNEPVLKRTRLVHDPATGYRELTQSFYVGSRYRYYIGFSDTKLPRTETTNAAG